jgi:drug/metabolite transporter (DMT)-like permease
MLLSECLKPAIGRICAHSKILVFGQALSLFLAGTSAMSASMHFDCNVSFPSFQTSLVFMLMSLHLIIVVFRKYKHEPAELPQDNPSSHSSSSSDDDDDDDDKIPGNSRPIYTYSMLCGLVPLHNPWWIYAGFAFISVEGSYVAFLAYKYTTLPSASLLDNVNIIAAMVGSRLLLGRRYTKYHILGALVCCLGVAMNIVSDFEKSGENPTDTDDENEKIQMEEYPHRLLGDLLALVGGMLFGLIDVLIEKVVKEDVSVDEYLGATGFFGFFFAVLQAFILETKELNKFFVPTSDNAMNAQEVYETYDDPFDAPRSCPRNNAVILLLAYVLCAYLFQSCMGRFLAVSESALFTLSILTADLWGVIFSVVTQHVPPPLLFYLAFVLVLIGVIIYEMVPSPLEEEETQENSGIQMTDSRLTFGSHSGNRDLELKHEIL